MEPGTERQLAQLHRRLDQLEHRIGAHGLNHEMGGGDTVRLHIREAGVEPLGRYRTLNVLGAFALAEDTATQEYELSLTQVTASGVYTPTLTNTTNIDASTASEAQYLRVGSTVTVSGIVTIDPAAAGAINLGISLPVASNFGTQSDAGGAASCDTAAASAAIYADATNDAVDLVGIAADGTSRTWGFTFTYQVI